MPKIGKHEIAPGLAVHLEPKVLVALADTLTNAADAAVVNRKGYFVVLSRYDERRWLCAPVFGEKEAKPNRTRLDGIKRGHPKWVSPNSYYSPHQFWAISDDDLVTASQDVEFSSEGNRNSYSNEASETTTLQEIASHKDDSSVGYRHVDKLPE